ncbi:MAG: single-stranded-DNA-specific exonuclease RecJ [Proteobacteria bacterium]|nr:single-stranded-DNA-specific exonuclease RecJ [Pseudomonadota bacterium]
MKAEWNIHETDPEIVSAIAHTSKKSPILASLLAQRGMVSPESAAGFLNPSLAALRSPFLMKGMTRAVERIVQAIEKKENILVFGDYDVDGITGTSLLYSFLVYAGAQVVYYIPHRVNEGYSFKPRHVHEVLVPRSINLVITVDCGSDSVAAVEMAAEQGIDVVITDHHSLPDIPPPAISIVNPKQKDCPSGLKHLAGVGVVFYLLVALRKTLRDMQFWKTIPEPNLKAYCDLVALGTIADIVPLIGENRILTQTGLDIINSHPSAGIKALIDVSKINKEQLNSEDIAFRIAPRLNAAGRIDHANLAFGLLSSKNIKSAKQAAISLDKLNSRRQSVEQQMLKEIEDHLSNNAKGLEQPAIILHRQGWHLGVLGIVASRISKKYYKPVVLIALDGDTGKGSGRSIPGIDLYQALSASSQSLVGFGGHAMAAGLEIHTRKLNDFKTEFNRYVEGITLKAPLIQQLDIDCRLDFDDICPTLIDDLEMLEPFGNHNPVPLFIADDISIVSSNPVGTQHRRLILRSEKCHNDTSLLAMHFNVDTTTPYPGHFNHLVFRLQWNRWNNSKSPQLIIEDYL